ncbi:hypothetical protein FE391_09205 [Nonomuraea sp. KC401]|uniref:hypothetical protein n=1 Tax=unclassified Nonomuraea TaxID=2593643 RepID=UPI0010FE9E05|nr:MULTISPECIES: hypothetical protein [unclassified Nonomuraea]NBE92573.1 hypothetical protein [Nonomuraea sp. K271]TLF79770.1 hypothetical protein FE391_09205 [Nonomuraea sp. KC401]
MREDSLVVAADELIARGSDALFGPRTDEFVAMVGHQHPSGALYKEATAEAIAKAGLFGRSSVDVASQVYENFIWTHFVCKLLMAATPKAIAEFAVARLDVGELSRVLASQGSAILSCFHYKGYPLMALRLAISPIAPLISKARVDVMDRGTKKLDGAADLSERVVHLSGRGAALRMTHALQRGTPVWVLLDVVLPSVRVTRTQFLGHEMNVGAGLGKIARLSGRPCVPLFWEMKDSGAALQVTAPLLPEGRSEDEMIQDFVNTQSAFITEQPAHWLEWYSLLDEAPSLRAEVKKGNEEIWARLAKALE